LNAVVALLKSPPGGVTLTANDIDDLTEVIGELPPAVNPANFIDGFHLVPATGMQVFSATVAAVGDLSTIYTDGGSALPKATILNLANLILTADKTLAQTAINEATAAGGNAALLQQAAQEMNNAAADLAMSRIDWDGAASHYGNAWQDALKSVGKL
jgi:hypothetical protein